MNQSENKTISIRPGGIFAYGSIAIGVLLLLFAAVILITPDSGQDLLFFLLILVVGLVIPANGIRILMTQFIIANHRLTLKTLFGSKTVDLSQLIEVHAQFITTVRSGEVTLTLKDNSGGKISFSLTAYGRKTYQTILPVIRRNIPSSAQIDDYTLKQFDSYSK